jgi:CBS domain-containing protein
MRVEQVMTRDVITVAPESPLKDVARLLVESRISGVPVCAADGRILGVVSEADILRREDAASQVVPRVLAWLLDRFDGGAHKTGVRTAADVMTLPAITARPGQSAADVARLMVDNKINRLPVVTNGKLVGIVSRADLVRAFTRGDAEIEQEIREDVIFRTLLLVPDDFTVIVREGRAEIRGEVRTEEDAEILTRCVGRIPGVLAERADVTWMPRRSRRPRDIAAEWQ